VVHRIAANKIGRITTSGVITEFAVPTANSEPWAVRGSGGSLWFAERAASKIAQINTSGQVLQEIPTPTANAQPVSLLDGPDGNIWFNEFSGNKLARLAPNGTPSSILPMPKLSPKLASWYRGTLYLSSMSVVAFVSSARKRFCQGVLSSLSRVAAALLRSVLIFGTCAAAYAESSSPSLTIDYDRLPTISVDAKGATVREILTQLADRLHFQIENPEAIENSPTFSGSFKGDFTDVLRRVLMRDVNYAILYRELAIERIVIVGSGTAGPGGAKPSRFGNVAGADDVRPTDTASAETAWTPPPTHHAPQAFPARNPLARLLEAQANITEEAVRQSDSAGKSSSATSATSSRSPVQSSASTSTAQMSLAAMTQAAQTNVRMLAKALNSVCIGANCAQ
jgi:hypothetical protein